MDNSDLNNALDSLRKLIPLAIDTLSELAVGAEKDSVRLAASEAILDRVGLSRGSTLTVNTSKEEHDQATKAAIELGERLKRNKELQPAPVVREVDVLVVLEGDEVAVTEREDGPALVVSQ